MAKNPSSSFDPKIDNMRVEAEIENSRQDNKSRSRIAYGFTYSFIFLLTIIIIGGPIYNATLGKDGPVDISELITTFVAQFGTPLGFVLGYYFKDKNN